MALLATVLLAAVAVGDFRLARALAARPRAALLVAVAALLFVLFYLGLGSHLLANVPWDNLMYFERLPAHGAILLILALCWYLPGRISRGVLLLLTLLGAGYGFLEVGGPMLLPAYASSLSDQVQRLPRGGIEVIQSTGWSCGPAALAWALETKGIPVTERQVAGLAGSTPFHGTTDAGLLRACHKLGLPATIRRNLRFDDLVALPKPCLVTWHLSGLVLHAIVVLGAGPDKVQVGDPMMGQVDYTREEFEHDWLRDALVVQ